MMARDHVFIPAEPESGGLEQPTGRMDIRHSFEINAELYEALVKFLLPHGALPGDVHVNLSEVRNDSGEVSYYLKLKVERN